MENDRFRPDGPPLASAYARWRSSTLGRITDRLQQQLLVDMAGSVPGLDVLDIGCGDGALATALALRGGRVTGLDADRQMLDAAQARSAAQGVSLRLACGQAQALPFRAASFDRVVAVTVLCFVRPADKAVGEMARVLRPGGRLVIGELGRWNVWSVRRRIQAWLGNPIWAAAHFRTPTDLRRLAGGQGLIPLETRGATYYPPCDLAASALADIDSWLGRRTTCGAAFIVLAADKP